MHGRPKTAPANAARRRLRARDACTAALGRQTAHAKASLLGYLRARAPQVDEAHAQLVDETRRLFYKYRALYPSYAHRELKIV